MTPRQWQRREAQMRAGADAARLCGYDGTVDGPEAARLFEAAEAMEAAADFAAMHAARL